MIPLLLITAAMRVAAQADSATADSTAMGTTGTHATGPSYALLAGISSVPGSDDASRHLIPREPTLGLYATAHMMIGLVDAFGMDIGVGLHAPFDGSDANEVAARLYPDHDLLAGAITPVSSMDLTIGPTWKFNIGRLGLRPAILVAYSLVLPRDDRLFLKRRGSNEYRSVRERFSDAGSLGVVPALILNYPLDRRSSSGIQFRIGYRRTHFAIAAQTTDQTLLNDDITSSNITYGGDMVFVAVGVYGALPLELMGL